MGRRLAECPSISAAQRHQRRGQVCQACRDFENAYRRERYAAAKARKADAAATRPPTDPDEDS